MDVPRRRWTLLAAAVLAALTLVPLAGPAAAHRPVTRCSDLGPDPAPGTVVDGDLLVDVGECELTSAVVHGDVRVPDAPDTYLLTWATTIDGTLRIAGYAQLYGSRVGAVRLSGPVAVLSINAGSSVVRDVRGQGQELSVFRTDVGGEVHVRAPQATLQEARVGRDVRLGDGYTWVWGSTIGGRLEVTRPSFVTVCGTSIGRDVTVRQARVAVDLGLPPADSSYACTDYPEYPTVTTVGGTVSLLGNVGPVRLADLHVARDLVCRGNTGGITDVGGVTVDGTRRGQCAGRPS